MLPKHHAVIFVHGCFWHRHAGCRYATVPATRPEFWKAKFDANVARDAAVQSDLLEAGWRVGTVWECALRTDTGISQGRDAVTTWLHCGGSSLEVGATNVASASCPGDARLERKGMIINHKKLTRHIGGTLDRADVWTRFLRDCGHRSLTGFGQFTIIEKASGAFVGKTGLARFERDLGPSADKSVECSSTLRSAHQGQGYAPEAASAALGWYDAYAGGPAACLIDEANVASLKLASFLGYFEVDRLTRLSGRAVVLRRDCPGLE